MRAHWINTWSKIIQAGIVNAVAPKRAQNYTLLVSDYFRRSQYSGIQLKEPPSITRLHHLPSYRNGDIIHTDEHAFGKEYTTGGENHAQFDTFYADGVGLSWRKCNDKDTTYLVDDILKALPHTQAGTEEESTQHIKQSRDKHSHVNEVIQVDEGSDSRNLKVNIGDEVRASLRVKGDKVKETTGIASGHGLNSLSKIIFVHY